MFRTGSIVVLVLATCLALLAVPAAADPPAQQSPTGFSISNPKFQDYFDHRGGARTLGYPISREFDFLGSRVQFFQRAVLQLNPDGGVGLLNILDNGLLPYTHINNSTFPGPDASVTGAAPSPSDPNYASMAMYFVKAYAPDEFDGLKVNFFSTFSSTVSYQDAFPNGDGEEGLLPLINLEIWGLPISKPAYDPNNKNFVYLRFQRGIMHFDKTTGLTQGILIGDYLKSVITGQNLPVDLANEAKSSRLYLQYNNGVVGGVNRPADLPGTSMFAAFEKDGVVVPTPPPYVPPTATAVPPTAAPAQPPAAPPLAINPNATPVAISIEGDPFFIESARKALDLIQSKVPTAYDTMRRYVYAIKQTNGQSNLDYATRTINVRVDDALPPNWRNTPHLDTSQTPNVLVYNNDDQITWFAGLIIHMGVHFEQAANGRPTTGYDAEREARLRQKDVLCQIETTYPGGQFCNYLAEVLSGRETVFPEWGPIRDWQGPTATPTRTP